MIRLHRKQWLAAGALALVLTPVAFLVPAYAQDNAGGGNPAAFHQIELMSKLLGVVGEFTKIADSPSASGVAATMGIDDHFKNPAEAIAFLEKVLPQVKDAPVQRAIRVKLADLYKKSGQHEKALEQLERLMTNRPGA
ncbi:MAG: tetratricopeptide repeat protein [Planctomycetota bacterium]|nr:tetratricopeptide repeat protein [Planctomycetota bacterium]